MSAISDRDLGCDGMLNRIPTWGTHPCGLLLFALYSAHLASGVVPIDRGLSLDMEKKFNEVRGFGGL